MSGTGVGRAPPPRVPIADVPPISPLDRFQDFCRRGAVEDATECLTSQPTLAKQVGNLGFTALHWASQTGHSEVVALLLKGGADLNVQNTNGDTPLHLATWKSHAPVVKQLLAAGAKIDLVNGDKKTAEELARSDEIRALFPKPAANDIQIVEEKDDESDED